MIHCNHAKELDDDIFAALKKIQCLGIPVMNSAVLLKDVNDDVDTLKTLCEALSDHGILPYYLHQLDRVQGSAHYEVPEERAASSSSSCNPFYPATPFPSTSAKSPASPAKRPSSIRARAQPPEEDNTLTFSEITG